MREGQERAACGNDGSSSIRMTSIRRRQPCYLTARRLRPAGPEAALAEGTIGLMDKSAWRLLAATGTCLTWHASHGKPNRTRMVPASLSATQNQCHTARGTDSESLAGNLAARSQLPDRLLGASQNDSISHIASGCDKLCF